MIRESFLAPLTKEKYAYNKKLIYFLDEITEEAIPFGNDKEVDAALDDVKVAFDKLKKAIFNSQMGQQLKESGSYDYDKDIVGQVIEGCKIHAIDNNITHPDDIYELCFDVAKKHGVEDKADYIAQIVHGYVAYVLN